MVVRGRTTATSVDGVFAAGDLVDHSYRQAICDTEIKGYAIKKDEIVMLNYIGGNVDAAKFGCPMNIDLERPNARQHLGFGYGIHYCIGNQLSRAEMRIAFDRLLTRLPNLRLDPDYPKPELAAIFHVHALDSLHIEF